MLPHGDNNKEIIEDDIKLLGKKKERDILSNYYTKEEAFNNFEYKNNNIPKDIELIKSYSKNLYIKLKQSPIEIINVVVSPFTKFNDTFNELYNELLVKIQQIPTSKKKIIKYMYNNGIIYNEPVVFPCDSNDIKNDENSGIPINNDNDNNNNIKEDSSNNMNSVNDDNLKNDVNPNFVTLNIREVWTSIKEYKWEGLIKIIILFGDNGFCKQIIKNIDCYHNNYLIFNLNTITPEQKAHFNNLISNKFTFDDIISYLKQDMFEHSTGKNKIKEISDKFDEYNDLLKRYCHYNCNTEEIPINDKNYLICLNLYKFNVIDINKNELALYDPNSCSKSFLCTCYTSKIKKEYNINPNLPNFINPNIIYNKIAVELAISNNLYNILNADYNEEDLNIHINNLTLNKKMIGYTFSKTYKNQYNQEYFLDNTLLNYAICDYICDIFNMKIYSNNINLNTIEIHLYEFTNYNFKYLIGKKYLNNYTKKYDQDLLECFSHFSFCISYGKLLIDNIKEYNGYIYFFNIFKDNENDESNDYQYINIFRFFCYHKCNKYCEMLGLKNVNKNFYDINPDNLTQFKNKRICCICQTIFNIDVKYNYNRDDLCLCFDCYNKIYNSKYTRVCRICENKFEYFYYFYILQKIDPPSLCNTCEKLKSSENNYIDDEDGNNKDNNGDISTTKKEEKFLSL